MDVLAENPFVEATALPFLVGIAFGLILKLPWSARPLAATILAAVVSLVLAGTVFGVPPWPPNSATQKFFYIICLGTIIGLGSDWALRRPAALIITTILLTAAAFAWFAVGRLRIGGVAAPVIVATIVSAVLAVGIIFTIRARVEGAPLEHHPFLVPGAVLVVTASTAIVSMLGAFLGMAQFLGGIAALMGGYCLVGYVALLFGRAPVLEWGPGTEFLLLYVAGAGLILTTLLAPEASASALIILVLSLAGPALIAGPLGRFLPAHRLLRPLAAGFVIAIPSIIAVLVAVAQSSSSSSGS
jgi:hypothetical protein